MCKAPKPPAAKAPKKPQFLRNQYLDENVDSSGAIAQLKKGRGSLRIPAGGGTTGGRQVGESLVQPTNDPVTVDANTPPQNGDFRPISGRGRGRRNPIR